MVWKAENRSRASRARLTRVGPVIPTHYAILNSNQFRDGTMGTPLVRLSFICCLPFAASAGGAR